MNEERCIGKQFCIFYTKWIGDMFPNGSVDMQLKFSKEKKVTETLICQGERKNWKDSRFCVESTESEGRFYFAGKNREYSSALKLFLAFLIKEIEKRFKDLLYLEAVEERICEKGEKWNDDKLVYALIGELLDRDWITRNYAKKILKENELPDLGLLVQISAQKYEQRLVKTKIYFYQKRYQACQGDIRFDQDDYIQKPDRGITLDNLRTIRKLMEMAGEHHGLIACKEQEIYYIEGVRREIQENLPLCTEFTGHMRWTLKKENGTLFEYQEGKIRISALEGSEQDIVWKSELYQLGEVIPELAEDSEAVLRIEGIIEALKRQSHGTSIVFMDKATLKKEKLRLSDHKRLYRMEPFSIEEQEKEIMGISSIDGALLADVSGNCHAVGAILDGKSVVVGNPGRGARYNSLINYVHGVYEEYRKENPETAWCFAAILSEDGIVSLGIPEKLRKQKV